MCTLSAGMAKFTEKAEPDVFWQCEQWQTATICGSASLSYLTLPHKQLPATFDIAFLHFE
jgi:hypothetical protein